MWLHPTPMRPCSDVTIWGCIAMMFVASCAPFPFSGPCDDMLTILVCATCWISCYVYMLAYMSMHESWVLVCCPSLNIMKLWTFDPNLHLSLADTTFCLPSWFVCFFVCLLSHLFVHLACLIACHLLCLPCLSFLSVYALFICSLYLFLPLLVC